MEEIKNIDSYETARDNYKKFGYYANATRALASDTDGLKTVYRRMLWTAMQYPKGKFVKSAVISGECMKIHPHSEQSGVLYSLVNSKLNLFDKQGNFGSSLISGSAPRYTECRYNKMAELYLGKDLLNYCEMVEGDIGYMEPKYLPTLIPFILVDGNNSMGIGISSSIPSIDIVDLAKYYRSAFTNEEVNLKLDLGHCLVNSTVWVVDSKIKSGSIRGLRYHPIAEVDGKNVVVTSIPPGMNVNKLMKVLHNDIESEKIDFRDESNSSLRLVFEVIKGDPYEVKSRLESISSSESYDMVYSSVLSDDHIIVYEDLSNMRNKSIRYLEECTIRKFTTELNKAQSRMKILEVIKYIKDHKIPGKLQDHTKEEVIKMIPFDRDLVNSVLQQSITRLTKGASEEEFKELERVIDNSKRNIENPKNYLISLYDEFIEEVSKFYKNKTKYKSSEGIQSTNLKGNYVKVEDGRLLISNELKEGYTEISDDLRVIGLREDGWVRNIDIPDKECEVSISEFKHIKLCSKEDIILIVCNEYTQGAAFRVASVVDWKRILTSGDINFMKIVENGVVKGSNGVWTIDYYIREKAGKPKNFGKEVGLVK